MTVVLVHGNPETDAVWGPLVDALGRDDVVRLSPPGFGAPLPDALAAARAAGLTVLAADGAGERDLDDLPELAGPHAWLFGNEAWGLPAATGALADARVRIPISPRAESLNLAAAAAVCLFASARIQRVAGGAGPGMRAIP